MFRYQLVTTEGVELGATVYSVGINPGETVHVGSGQRLRVLDVVVFEDEGSDWVGLLKVVSVAVARFVLLTQPRSPGR